MASVTRRQCALGIACMATVPAWGQSIISGQRFTSPVFLSGTVRGVLYDRCQFDAGVFIGLDRQADVRDLEFRDCWWPNRTTDALAMYGAVRDVRVVRPRIDGVARYGVLAYNGPTGIMVTGGSIRAEWAGVYVASVGTVRVTGTEFSGVTSDDYLTIPKGAVALNSVLDAVVTETVIRDCTHGIAAFMAPNGVARIADNSMARVGTHLRLGRAGIAIDVWGGNTDYEFSETWKLL